MKILWLGDAVATTGFATVTQAVCRELTALGHEIVILGINHQGDPPPPDWPWRIYPTKRGSVGNDRLAEVTRRERPDVIFALGDPWVIPFYLDALREARLPVPVVAYLPVDAANQWAGKKLNGLAAAVAYTAFGARELRKGGYTGRLEIVPHGIDLTTFYPEPTARERLPVAPGVNGLPQPYREGYLIGNVNRNQPRKRLDLTIDYFATWWHDAGRPADAFLLLHCALIDAGWEVSDLAKYFGVDDRLLLTGSKDLSRTAPVARLRLVYNCLDVQVSTTVGEGWGLTTMEGMACGVPQILPDSSAYREWAGGAAWLVPCDGVYVHTNGVNSVGLVPRKDAFLHALDEHYRRGRRTAPSSEALACVHDARYTWPRIGRAFANILQSVVPAGQVEGVA